MSLHATCSFHGVGQGLFYSAIINVKISRGKSRIFSFVYDCGTSSKRKWLSRSIKDFVDVLPESKNTKPKLDLLVISHFHEDHINGLKELLESVDVGTVILPYVAPELLLLYALCADTLEPFLQAFYSDPITTIASYGVDIIVQNVVSDEDYLEPRQHEENSKENQYDGIKSDIVIKSQGSISEYKINNTQVEVKVGVSEAVNHRIAWEFRFWNQSLPTKFLQDYLDSIEGYRMQNGFLNVAHLIGDPAFIRKLKKACQYGWLLNKMSIIMHHQPKQENGALLLSAANDICALTRCECMWECRHYCKRCRRLHEEPRNCATLLTGDIDLTEFKDNSDTSQAAANILNNPAEVILVPHHGSWTEWDSIDKRLRFARVYVVSYGVLNLYGHPDSTTLSKIMNDCMRIAMVHEGEGFSYNIIVS